MDKRKTVTRDSIRNVARGIIEQKGVEVLSMRSLASALGIKAPSLYDHVRNRQEVIALVQADGLTDFGDGFAKVGNSAQEKVMFYRDWALRNRNLYPVVFQEFLHRDLLPEGLEAQVLGQVIEAAGGSHIQARVLWAQLHGLVDLELHGRLPSNADMDTTWGEVIASAERMRIAKMGSTSTTEALDE